jgi:serine/threonine-protein kinase
MAAVYLGKLIGPAGFSRAVAIKRLHPHLAHDPQFVGMLFDEARIAARIRHPNVVPTLDMVSERGEFFIVMEFVHGESLSKILKTLQDRAQGRVPPAIASAIVGGMLAGLHAAHEATSEDMQPLGVVHRDVSPPNVLLGSDGIPRTVDFGIAVALGRLQVTKEGELKGKLPYMAPEQIRGEVVDRRVDLWATACVLWELLAGRRLFAGEEASLVFKILAHRFVSPFEGTQAGNGALDLVLERALAVDKTQRYETAAEMLTALELACPPASPHQVARWLEQILGHSLSQQRVLLSEIETSGDEAPPLSTAALPANVAPRRPSRALWPFALATAVGIGGAGAALYVKSSAFGSAASAPPRSLSGVDEAPTRATSAASAEPSSVLLQRPAQAELESVKSAVPSAPASSSASTSSTSPSANPRPPPAATGKPVTRPQPAYPATLPAVPGGGGI